jgi:hypothetical protein
MAEHPDLDRKTEPQPLPGEVERERADISVVSILAVLTIVIAAGFWLFTKDKEMVAGDGTTVTQTTGSRSDRPSTPGVPASDTSQAPAPTQAAPPSPAPSQQ